MNNSFNSHRFYNTLKLDIATNWRRFSRIFFGELAGFLCMFLVFTLAMRGCEIKESFSDGIMGMTMMSYFVAFIFMGLSGVYMFNNMKTKQDRISFLTLPASNLEKFLSRYIMTTVGMIISILLALLIADLVRMLFGFIIGVHFVDSIFLRFLGIGWHYALFDYYKMANSVAGVSYSFYIWLVIFIFTTVMAAHAEFMLGGTLFRKHPMLLTILSLVVIGSFQASIIPGSCWELIFLGMDRKPNTFEVFSYGNMFWTIVLPNIVITIFCYWASYKLFCRSQVISNKWINL